MVTNACAFLLESLGYDVNAGRRFLAQASLYQVSRITGYANAGTDGQGVRDALRQCGSTPAVVYRAWRCTDGRGADERGAVDFRKNWYR